MKFILYSYYNKDSIQNNLGKPEYSYYYLLETFRPALEKLGSIAIVKNPEKEVDLIYQECCKQKEPCFFLSFSPPNKTLIGLPCPTISIFAWEFSNMPDRIWDLDPRNDWRNVFGSHGRAITLSTHSETVVRNGMGPHFPVKAIPAPVWDRVANARNKVQNNKKITKQFELFFRDKFIDSRNLADKVIEFKDPEDEEFKDSAHVRKIPIDNTDSSIKSFKDYVRDIKNFGLGLYRKYFRRLLPSFLANILAVTKFCISFFIHSIKNEMVRIIKTIKSGPKPPPPALQSIMIDSGVVYTSILNQFDGRKNWHDIITAFCWAHREVTDATLIMKFIKSDDETVATLENVVLRLKPFKCRVILLFGYLDSAEYAKLIEATTYYVNASHCEGLCIPLMEYMACGKPAICPSHTAMKDYIDDSVAFIVKSSVEYYFWPHMLSHLYCTQQYRIEWESLHDAYVHSYNSARLPIYEKMGECAMERIRSYCEDDVVIEKLRQFLECDSSNQKKSQSNYQQPHLSLATG